MLSGADLRKYRKKLGLSQHDMAKALGVSQASLSQVESGKLAISSKLQAKMEKEFGKAKYPVRYPDFARTVEKERQSQQTLVGNPDVTFQLLPVWEWEDNFDLSAAPSSLERRGVAAVRTIPDGAIAFAMPKGSALWAEGEILVFTRASLKECRTGDLCLVQVRPARSSSVRSMIVSVRQEESGPHFEPANRTEPTIAADPRRIEGLLKCVYRARYLV